MLRPLLTLLLLASVLETHSQYILQWNDVPRSYNRDTVFLGRDLGQMLLDGYLRGKIKAYDFNIGSEDLKWAAPTDSDFPPEWVSDFGYVQTELVTWKGKCYEATRDVVNQKKAPDANPKDWKEHPLRGRPVSTRYWFPTDKDTTSKEEFLEKFNMYVWPGDPSPWEAQTEYFSGNVVKYKGRFYECSADNRNKRPDMTPGTWHETEERIGFTSPSGLSYFSILSAVDGTQTIPQMLSLYHYDINGEMVRCPGLNFKYEDVCIYLADLKVMPMVYDFPYGYTGGPQLMLDSNDLVEFLQSGIRSGKLKPTKNQILSAEDYELFLGVDLHASMDIAYSLNQDLNTHDVSLNVWYPGIDTNVLKLPWESVESLIKTAGAAPKITTYLDWLNSFKPTIGVDTLRYDSLPPRPYHLVTGPPPSKISFTSEHLATAKANPSQAVAMQSLWTLMKKGVEEKKISLEYSNRELFPCDTPLPQLTLKYGDRNMTLPQGFNFSPFYELKIDTADRSRAISGIGVQYVRTISPLNRFEPYKIAFVLHDPEVSSDHTYYFRWQDAVDSAKDRDDLQSLIAAVLKGSLDFESARVADGVIGSR